MNTEEHPEPIEDSTPDMPDMAAVAAAVGLPPEEEEPAEPLAEFALLFELEYLAANARVGTFEVLKKAMSSRKLDFTENHYARFSSYVRPEYYVDELLELMGNKKLSSTKLVDEVNSGIAAYITTNTNQLDPTLAKIIDTAKAKGMIVAALTAMPKAVYGTFVNKLGLEDRGVQIFSFTDADKHFPRADSWLKVAKEIQVAPRKVVSLVTTTVACKGALTAGMRCIAIPDGYTAYQDFGGAYSVIDNIEDVDMDDVFSIIPDEDED